MMIGNVFEPYEVNIYSQGYLIPEYFAINKVYPNPFNLPRWGFLFYIHWFAG